VALALENNSRILADFSETFDSRPECLKDIDRVKPLTMHQLGKTHNQLDGGCKITDNRGEAGRFPPRALIGCAGERRRGEDVAAFVLK
jgi:hypothetical protein